jgi:hypothetical protein
VKKRPSVKTENLPPEIMQASFQQIMGEHALERVWEELESLSRQAARVADALERIVELEEERR